MSDISSQTLVSQVLHPPKVCVIYYHIANRVLEFRALRKMDAILDIYFEEGYFKMLKKRGRQGLFDKDILTTNKYKYMESVLPILESDQITKAGIVNLPC